MSSHPTGLIAFEKPEGTLTHPNRAEISERALLQARYDQRQESYRWEDEKGETRVLTLFNRLDSPTSGVVLATLNPGLVDIIRQQFADHTVRKGYYAIVAGRPKAKKGEWTDRLGRSPSGPDKLRVKRGGPLLARTRYEWVRKDPKGWGLSMLKLDPKTGRTHQLRVQCQLHGVPIIGDRTYGNFRLNREVRKLTGLKRLFLHAAEIRVSFHYQGREHNFHGVAPMPDTFHQVLELHGGSKFKVQGRM